MPHARSTESGRPLRFQKSLGIAPNMLARRLGTRVEEGLLERRRYSEHPPRDEYVLTERGPRFSTGVPRSTRLGNKHFTPDGVSVLLAHKQTGTVADPVLVDRASGRELSSKRSR